MKPARLHERDIVRPGGNYDRTWHDAMGRPLLGGELWLKPIDIEGEVTAPVRVQVVSGRMDVNLEPGTYKVTGKLQTFDRQTVNIDENIEVVPVPKD